MRIFGMMVLAVLMLSVRLDAGDFLTINLKPCVNMGFVDTKADDQKGGWTDQGPTNDMRRLKSGTLKYKNVPFKIIDASKNKAKSCIVLRGKYRKYFPLESKSIKVDSRGDMIYFLGACAWSGVIGEDVLRMIVQYDNKNSYCDTAFAFGEHIGSWWGATSLPLGDIAWEASNGSAEVGLYAFAWKNPYPEDKIKSIRFVSCDGDTVPIIVAATLVKPSKISQKLLGELDSREKKFRHKTQVQSAKVVVDYSKLLREIPAVVASVSNGRTVTPVYIPQGKMLVDIGSSRPFYRIQTHSVEPSVSKGKNDFRKLDGILDYIDKMGFVPMVSISKGPAWIARTDADGNPLKRWIPDNQEAYVEYCKAIVRHCVARENPVLWYELGNEPDLKGWSYKLYIRLFKAISPELRKINSKIKLGGPVTCGPNLGWAKMLLENATEDVDFISYHQYGYSEPFSSPDEHIMSRLKRYESAAKKYKKLVQNTKKDCLIFLTEANTSWRCPKTDPRIRTIFGAAWTTSAVANYTKGSGDVFNYFTFNGGFGMTWVMKGSNMLFPAYHSYWLLRNFFKGTLVDAVKDQDVVNVYGCFSKGQANAFVVNVSNHKIDVTINMQNVPFKPGACELYVLNDKTWQQVKEVSPEGVVPTLKPYKIAVPANGDIKFTLAPYEVRVIRLLEEKTKLLFHSIVSENENVEKNTDDEQSKNLLQNPSAETKSDIIKNMPAGWSVYPLDADIKWSDANARTGQKSLAVNSSTKKRGAYWISDVQLKVSPGDVYKLEGYIKTSNAWGDNVLKLVWYDASNKWITSNYTKAVNGNKDWTKVEVRAVAPTKAKILKVFIGRRFFAPARQAWFDDIVLTKISCGQNNDILPKSTAMKKEQPKPFMLKAGKMEVRIQPARAWTIDLFKYDGKTLSTPVGNNAVAIDFGRNDWVGGNHKEGGREKVLEKSLFVDGKEIFIPAGGTITGDSFVFTKRAILKDIELRLKLSIYPDKVIEEYKMKALCDTYINKLMVAMHCWRLSTTEYAAKLLDGKIISGKLTGSGKYTLEESIQVAAIYDPTIQMAMQTTFDKANPLGQGHKHTFFDHKKYYHKQYYQILHKKNIKEGEAFNITATFRPVEITTDKWTDSLAWTK